MMKKKWTKKYNGKYMQSIGKVKVRKNDLLKDNKLRRVGNLGFVGKDI